MYWPRARSVVERHELAVTLGRTQEQPGSRLRVGHRSRVLHIAEQLARIGGERVQVRRLAQIAQRRIEFVAAPVRFPSLQIRRHRARFQLDRDAQCLDGGVAVVPRQGIIAALDELPV